MPKFQEEKKSLNIRTASVLTEFVVTLHAKISGRKKEFEGTSPSHTGSDAKCSKFHWLYCISWRKYQEVSTWCEIC